MKITNGKNLNGRGLELKGTGRGRILRLSRSGLGLLLLCCAVLAVAASAYSRREPATTAVALAPGVSVEARQDSINSQSNSNRQGIEGEIITITRGGFEPAELTRPMGRFGLFVQNRSGLEEVTLRLDRVAGSRLREVPVPREKLDWDDVIDLTPGRYVLTEANNPDWVCNITITPN